MKNFGMIRAAFIAATLASCSILSPNSHRAPLLEMLGLDSCDGLEQTDFSTNCCSGITMDYTDTITFKASATCLSQLREGALRRGFNEKDDTVWIANGPGSYDELDFDANNLTLVWRDTEI